MGVVYGTSGAHCPKNIKSRWTDDFRLSSFLPVPLTVLKMKTTNLLSSRVLAFSALAPRIRLQKRVFASPPPARRGHFRNCIIKDNRIFKLYGFMRHAIRNSLSKRLQWAFKAWEFSDDEPARRHVETAIRCFSGLCVYPRNRNGSCHFFSFAGVCMNRRHLLIRKSA